MCSFSLAMVVNNTQVGQKFPERTRKTKIYPLLVWLSSEGTKWNNQMIETAKKKKSPSHSIDGTIKIPLLHKSHKRWACKPSWGTVFVCLFVCCLSPHSIIFHLYGDVTITDEGLQILTYARYSWPLSNEGSLACHTYCDTRHPFIMVISETVTSTPIAKHLAVELALPVFTTYVCRG